VEQVSIYSPAEIPDLQLLHACFRTRTFPRHGHEGYGGGVIEQGALGFHYRGENVVAPAPCDIRTIDPLVEEIVTMISKKNMSLIFCGLVAISGPALANGIQSAGDGHGDETIGIPGEASQVDRTVKIEMNDEMRFIPSRHGQTGRDYTICSEEFGGNGTRVCFGNRGGTQKAL